MRDGTGPGAPRPSGSGPASRDTCGAKPSASPLARHAHRRRGAGGVGGGALAWVALGTAAASWRVYRDPLGLFRVSLPAQWTATVTPGGYGAGNPAGFASGPGEDIVFSDPAQVGGSAQLWVHADQITSAFGRTLFCDSFRTQEDTTFNGYPAADTGGGGLFESADAHFQVAGTIPGVTESVSMQHFNPTASRPTPLPGAWVETDQSLLTRMLASLAPVAGPLACP